MTEHGSNILHQYEMIERPLERGGYTVGLARDPELTGRNSNL